MASILSRSLYLQNVYSHRSVSLGIYSSKIIVRNYDIPHALWIRQDAEARFKHMDKVSPDSELIYSMPYKKTVQAAYTVGAVCTATGIFSMAYLVHIIPGQETLSTFVSEYYRAFVETLQVPEQDPVNLMLGVPLATLLNTLLLLFGRGIPLRIYYDPIADKYTAIFFTFLMIGKNRVQFSAESLKPAYSQSDLIYMLNWRPLALSITCFRCPDDYYTLIGNIPT